MQFRGFALPRNGGTPRGAETAPRSNHKFPGYRPRKFTVCFAPLLPEFSDHQVFRFLRKTAQGSAFGIRKLLKKFDQNFHVRSLLNSS